MAEKCGRMMYLGHGYRIPCSNVKPCPTHPTRRLAAPPTAGAPVLPLSDDPAGAPADIPMVPLFESEEAA